MSGQTPCVGGDRGEHRLRDLFGEMGVARRTAKGYGIHTVDSAGDKCRKRCFFKRLGISGEQIDVGIEIHGFNNRSPLFEQNEQEIAPSGSVIGISAIRR